MNLAETQCSPVKKEWPPLTRDEEETLLAEIDHWHICRDGINRLKKDFICKGFSGAMDFAAGVGDIANAQDHHPDIHISYGKVGIELSTHTIKGLSKNDFILAAKIDLFSQNQGLVS